MKNDTGSSIFGVEPVKEGGETETGDSREQEEDYRPGPKIRYNSVVPGLHYGGLQGASVG